MGKKMATPENKNVIHDDPVSSVFICIGNGPSLTQEDVNFARKMQKEGRAKIIVINDAFQWAPDAWAVYGADYRWWRARHPDLMRVFPGRRFSLDESAVADFRAEYVHCEDIHKPLNGLAISRESIRHGYSSGFQAMHLARNLGAKLIVLLGYDYGATGNGHAAPAAYAHAATSDFPLMLTAFNSAAASLHQEGVKVVNATRESAITCFPRATIEEAFNVSAS